MISLKNLQNLKPKAKLQVFEIQDSEGSNKPMTLKFEGNKIDILTEEFFNQDGAELVITETE